MICMCSSISSDCHHLALPELSIIREDGSGRVCPDNRCYTNTLSDGVPSFGETGELSLCILYHLPCSNTTLKVSCTALLLLVNAEEKLCCHKRSR
jgi:hypothetical protein